MAKRNGLPQLDRSDQRLAALPGVAWILSSSSDMACERRATAACRKTRANRLLRLAQRRQLLGPQRGRCDISSRSGVYLIEDSVKLDSGDR